MSQREDRIRTAVIAALSGVNERSHKTDLQSQESSLLEGTYPAASGRQEKIPGKLLLGKFDQAVFGIHQFWTPYGYGNNLYQYEGDVGVGPWITPPGGPIKNPPIPPNIPDDTGIIPDELGNNPELPGGGVIVDGGTISGGTGETGTGTATPGGGGGSPPPDPDPPEADFTLRYGLIYINFGGAGVQLRDYADALHVYDKNPIDGGTLQYGVSARNTDAVIAAWNIAHPNFTVTKQVQPPIGDWSTPVASEPGIETFDDYVGQIYFYGPGPYWIAYRRMYFLDTEEVHSQTWNGYYL